jgi:hypothetical protein
MLAKTRPVANWVLDCNGVVFSEEFSKEKGENGEARHERSD